MPGATRLILDGAAMAELLHGPGGVVAIEVMEAGERVKVEAVRRAPKRTGRLSMAIVKRMVYVGSEVACSVICMVPYAYFVHEGTPPHDIPNAFGWGVNFGIGGRFSGFFHPGTKPNRFLSESLFAAVA